MEGEIKKACPGLSDEQIAKIIAALSGSLIEAMLEDFKAQTEVAIIDDWKYGPNSPNGGYSMSLHRLSWTALALIASVAAIPFLVVVCLWLGIAMVPPLIGLTFKIVRAYGNQ
jgi:hypothetical protein